MSKELIWSYRFTVIDEQSPLSSSADGLILRVKAIPGAGHNQISGTRSGELLVRVQARAFKGEANQALLKYLAKILAVPKSGIWIVSGQTSRHKLLRLPAEAGTALEALLSEQA